MSRWLSSVNNLLEKLDDRVETVVEERAGLAQEDDDDDDGDVEGGGRSVKATAALHHILAKRGLSSVDSQDDDDDENVKDDDREQDVELGADQEESGSPELTLQSGSQKDGAEPDILEPVEKASPSQQVDATEEKEQTPKSFGSHHDAAESYVPTTNDNPTIDNETSQACKDTHPPTAPPKQASSKDLESKVEAQSKATPVNPPPNVSTPIKKQTSGVSHPPRGTPTRSQKERELTLEAKEAQKEARTLRRHVVSLNEQLEAAENELQAQRKELERAAERIEKDRIRNKEEKEASVKRQAQEIAVLKEQNEKTLKEQQARFEEQIKEYRKRLTEVENKRQQEGGDWNKEISQAIDREQEMRLAVSVLEDEKAVLLSRISTLEGQQTALGSRLESLTQAADNAMEREREAEDRLDSLLNQHARQISQRQAREAELEQTIQELNAALVASRKIGSPAGSNDVGTIEGGSSPDSRIRVLEMELDTANSHLALERERTETLQMQLRDLSKETTHEATAVHQKQLQAERKISDMSLTISKLEASLREAEKKVLQDPTSSERTAQEAELANQIQVLSEEVMRLRDKIAGQNSESLALKHRLKSALDKAAKLEDELASARQSQNGNGDVYDTMERAQTSRRRRPGAMSNTGSIRSAMWLATTGGERTQQIGQAIDAVDSFAVTTGKYLRRNPLARAGFIFYLIMIHLWSFVILFFHAHSFQEHGDFGAGVGVPHGPHAMMMEHKLMNPTTPMNADASGVIPDSDGAKHNNHVQQLDKVHVEAETTEVKKEKTGEDHEGGAVNGEEDHAAIVKGDVNQKVTNEGEN